MEREGEKTGKRMNFYLRGGCLYKMACLSLSENEIAFNYNRYR